MNVGIFGGTFDPVHTVHILLAELIKTQFGLDKIIFVPTGNPPHKVDRRITPSYHRINMLKLALANRPYFEVSSIETDTTEMSYSVTTVARLQKQSSALSHDGKPDNFFFIIGGDSLADLLDWHDYEKLFTLCTFIAVRRPGASDDRFDNAYHTATKAGARILIADSPVFDVSSTDIRFAFENDLACDNAPVLQHIDASVAQYISENKLYTAQTKRLMTIDEMKQDLKRLLTEERYVHSLGVMDEAVRIAKIYGADVEKCRLAGLLHDCAKQLTAAQYKWLGINENASPDGFDGGTADYDDGGKAARHGRAGAILAAKRYGIEDKEILEAISVHTTGAPEMSLVAQVIFIADFTEIGREGKHSQEVRDKLNISLLDAIVEECDCAIKHNIKRRDRLLSLDTIRTRNWALTQLNRK